MSVSDDEAAARRLAARLEELGVATTGEQARELASVQAALEAWIRIAAELAKRGAAGEEQPR
jgi:hypothetical protein